jgi:hypothetical protein
MLRSLRPALLVLVLATGCGPTRIPPPPAAFDTVVVTSSLTANALYADALAAFIRNNWEYVPDETGGLTLLILPDGASADPDALDLLLRVVVVPLDPETGEPVPDDLADPDYAGPDLSRRELEDRLRGQNDVDSLRALARLDPTNVGSAVLTVSMGEATPATRSVLVRAAKILASVSGTISYR